MLPRQVLPRQFYLITRRCTQRQFLLRPDTATNNAFLYCLIDAALRCEIDVLLPCAMSNHYHAVISDRAGRYPEFIEHLALPPPSPLRRPPTPRPPRYNAYEVTF